MSDSIKINNNELMCKQFQPYILPPVRRIIVIGDIHGDMDYALECLKIARVIDNNKNWIGGDTVVVQVGDQVDRCRPKHRSQDCTSDPTATPDDEDEDGLILEFFSLLHLQAMKNGGAVYSLLGNHELMNATGDLRYVSKKGIDGYGGKENRIREYGPRGKYGQLMGCTRMSSLIIGDWIFVHAGITPEFIKKHDLNSNNNPRENLIELNEQVKKWLLGKINKDQIPQIIQSRSYSMFWHRILGSIPPNMNNEHPMCSMYLDDVLELFNVKNMVIGHTPQVFNNKEGINSTCGNKVWRVDTGSSKAFNFFDDHFLKTGTVDQYRKAQVLEIIDNVKVNILK